MATDLTRYSRFRSRHFDRDADFVVLRPIKVGGHDLRPGDVFDKTMTSLRMHKVLFQQRKVDEVGGCWHKISGLPNPVVQQVNDAGALQVSAAPQPERMAADVPVKRKGRPKGSKNKPRSLSAGAAA